MTFPAMSKYIGLYPVVDSPIWIARLLDLGVTTLQIRIKQGSIKSKELAIHRSVELANRYHARLFVNDEWQLAINYAAYGIHLGQEDLEHADLNAISAAGLRLGISTHGPNEIVIARKISPSYIALGHIFPTQTKLMPSRPQGIAQLLKQVAILADFPTIAIGGISLARAPEVLATGVGGIAVVSAITQAQDWRQATRTLQNLVVAAETASYAR